ncbi:hypothetical protein Pfo_023430 [Paulownia fortunei]|nr:hypothetical protein Pfo_023430 [Paulownia fortunei]
MVKLSKKDLKAAPSKYTSDELKSYWLHPSWRTSARRTWHSTENLRTLRTVFSLSFLARFLELLYISNFTET